LQSGVGIGHEGPHRMSKSKKQRRKRRSGKRSPAGTSSKPSSRNSTARKCRKKKRSSRQRPCPWLAASRKRVSPPRHRRSLHNPDFKTAPLPCGRHGSETDDLPARVSAKTERNFMKRHGWKMKPSKAAGGSHEVLSRVEIVRVEYDVLGRRCPPQLRLGGVTTVSQAARKLQIEQGMQSLGLAAVRASVNGASVPMDSRIEAVVGSSNDVLRFRTYPLAGGMRSSSSQGRGGSRGRASSAGKGHGRGRGESAGIVRDLFAAGLDESSARSQLVGMGFASARASQLMTEYRKLAASVRSGDEGAAASSSAGADALLSGSKSASSSSTGVGAMHSGNGGAASSSAGPDVPAAGQGIVPTGGTLRRNKLF
jgi:hypothetical protein